MLLSRRFITLTVLAAGLLASCAQMPSPGDIEGRAKAWAESEIEQYGLARGSPREAKLRSLAVRTLSDESFIAASRTKPSHESWNDWEARLTNEGANFIDGDVLLRFLRAKARLFSEATDEECVAGVQMATNNESQSPILDAISKATNREVHPQVRAVWRQRVARISEEDFDALSEVPMLAKLARAKRIGEPLPVFSPSEHARVRHILESLMIGSASVSSQKKMVDAAVSGDPLALCNVVRQLTTAQSRLSSADARIGLQVFGTGTK